MPRLAGSTITPASARPDQMLAVSITKSASKQTYYTIRFLVDRELVFDAYRAYAYFRWVDDQLDQNGMEKSDRQVFVNRQSSLVDHLYSGQWPPHLTNEETMLANLIKSDHERDSGLQAYIRNMMAVMAFDAERQGRLISQDELTSYTHHLAIGVTEALHYFIGHTCEHPKNGARYLSAAAAHIVHMLRDTLEDVPAGYFNIPREYVEAHNLNPWDVKNDSYRAWVRHRVQLGRSYFKAGRGYLSQIENLRCRLAGYAYIARFESVLDALERDGYLLRYEYPECKRPSSGLRMNWSVLLSVLNLNHKGVAQQAVSTKEYPQERL